MGDGRTTRDTTIGRWTEALAGAGGDPGGGSAAGVTLAIAAALMSMVARYSDDDAALDRADALRGAALDAADADADVSAALGAAMRRKDDERAEAIRGATLEAARSSARLGDHARGAISDLEHLAARAEGALVADVAVAAAALRAALSGARANLSSDLGLLRTAGLTLAQVRMDHPDLCTAVAGLDDAIARVDGLTTRIDHRVAPTD